MLKKLFNIMKKNVKEEKKESEEIEFKTRRLEPKIENEVLDVETKNNEVEGEESNCSLDISVDDVNTKDVTVEATVCLDKVEKECDEKENELEENTQYIHVELSEEDREYIKDIKIKRGKSIRAIDVYSEEVKEFKTHSECSKKLKIPMDYIKENLKYGYTDYLGQAINYLREELKLDTDGESSYLESSKTPMELFNGLNNKIFTTKMSEYKREEILCSEKIEPLKMHYKFECIDEEYDEYFTKYKSIIKRGGKKRVELVDKKGEVIERFKSLDDCANYLNKEKNEVVDMLKYKDTKVGRYEIRYSLRGL
ncbi:hypothetical protein [[Clostridium] dakarense]|uniref:hypothetical protein n=1 Tax=Faecalimicrobium dakarense TaxID=1301100 RepID=UPI0004B192A0|nr:hypothetical protein [[Clostridium] dakarense]